MRISSYNPQDRYRRRNSEQFLAFLIVISVIVLAFLLGVWFGKQRAMQIDKDVKTQLETALNEREELQDRVTALSAEAQTANSRYEQLQEEFAEILPEGPLRELSSLLKQQLDEGRSPERLSFLIRSARPPRNCTEPQTKRFVVSSPAYSGPDSSVSLAEGALIISGEGESSVNTNGKPEAWYDPSKGVKIQFAYDGQVVPKSGVLPLRHSLVVANREYRITVAPGARSFAKVTFDSCDYP